MIINKDIGMKYKIYYLGSTVLSEITSSALTEFDILDVFARVKQAEPISMNLYNLTLDWLFMLGAIDIKNGRIIKCF